MGLIFRLHLALCKFISECKIDSRENILRKRKTCSVVWLCCENYARKLFLVNEMRRWRPPGKKEGGWDWSKRGIVRPFQIELSQWWIGFMQRWRRCLIGRRWGVVKRWGRQFDPEGGDNEIKRRWSNLEEDEAI